MKHSECHPRTRRTLRGASMEPQRLLGVGQGGGHWLSAGMSASQQGDCRELFSTIYQRGTCAWTMAQQFHCRGFIH